MIKSGNVTFTYEDWEEVKKKAITAIIERRAHQELIVQVVLRIDGMMLQTFVTDEDHGDDVYDRLQAEFRNARLVTPQQVAS